MTVIGRIIFLILSLLLFPLTNFAQEKINIESLSEIREEIFEVFLNEERKGEFFILIRDNDILFTPQDFGSLGFKETPEGISINGEKHISLKSLYPNVRFELDESKLTLHIIARPELLITKTIDLTYARPYNILYPKEFSAFFNYALNYSASEGFDFQALDMPFEIGIRHGDYLLYSNLSYRKTKWNERLVRLMSNIIWDDRNTMIKGTIGDFVTSSGTLIGGVENLGGIRIAKEFSIDPYFIRYPYVKLSGYLERSSELELYLNGTPIRKERFSPGGFELVNLPLTTGLQDLELVIKDAYGREERLKLPFYFTSKLLKPGLHDWCYSFGFKREDFGKESFQYSNLAFLGYHRFGLNNNITIGLRGEADKEIVNLGPIGTFLLGKIGAIETAAALSFSDGRIGYAASIEYNYSYKKFSTGILFKFLSREYTNLSLKAIKDKPRVEGLFSLGYHLKGIGSLSIGFTMMDRYYGADTKRVFGFFNRRLFKNVNLHIRASTTKQESKTTNEVFIGMNLYLGKGASGGVSYSRVEDNLLGTAYIQKNPPSGEGFGYQLLAGITEDNRSRETTGTAYFQYRGQSNIYSVDYRKWAGKDNYNLTLSGGISLIDRSIHLSRPITDSFALIKVAELKDITIYLNNQKSGKTNKKGELLVPELISYHDNKLSIEDKDIPMDYKIGEIERYVSPPLRGGATVEFNVRKIQDLTGRIFLIKNGKKLTPELGSLNLKIDGRIIETVIGKGGEFYIEDVRAGRFASTLIYEGIEYIFELIIPESDEMVIDIGEIIL